jgi:2-methylisocitrate lyase-like PEP mutase family enzyme
LQVPGPKLANMLEQGATPILPPSSLKDLGYTMAAYPLTLLSAAIVAMESANRRIYQEASTEDLILSFKELKDRVGFTYYGIEESRYKIP